MRSSLEAMHTTLDRISGEAGGPVRVFCEDERGGLVRVRAGEAPCEVRTPNRSWRQLWSPTRSWETLQPLFSESLSDAFLHRRLGVLPVSGQSVEGSRAPLATYYESDYGVQTWRR